MNADYHEDYIERKRQHVDLKSLTMTHCQKLNLTFFLLHKMIPESDN